MPPIVVRRARLLTRVLKLHAAALFLALLTAFASVSAVTDSVPGALRVAKVFMVFASLTFTWAVMLFFRVRTDKPRWAWVRVYQRHRPVFVWMREDPDAPEGTYRACRLSAPGLPWKPPTLITRVSVNAFNEGETLVFGTVAVPNEFSQSHDAPHHG